jgi:hypothetical protein
MPLYNDERLENEPKQQKRFELGGVIKALPEVFNGPKYGGASTLEELRQAIQDHNLTYDRLMKELDALLKEGTPHQKIAALGAFVKIKTLEQGQKIKVEPSELAGEETEQLEQRRQAALKELAELMKSDSGN